MNDIPDWARREAARTRVSGRIRGLPTIGPLMRPCEYCGKTFAPRNKTTRYCSKICKDQHWKRENPVHAGLQLPTGTVGAISEIVSAADLLKRGYEVFRAMSPACSCDLIALGPDRVPLRIEVRTGRRSPATGNLAFSRNGRKIIRKGRTEAGLDHYCVVVEGGQEIIYIPPLPQQDQAEVAVDG